MLDPRDNGNYERTEKFAGFRNLRLATASIVDQCATAAMSKNVSENRIEACRWMAEKAFKLVHCAISFVQLPVNIHNTRPSQPESAPVSEVTVARQSNGAEVTGKRKRRESPTQKSEFHYSKKESGANENKKVSHKSMISRFLTVKEPKSKESRKVISTALAQVVVSSPTEQNVSETIEKTAALANIQVLQSADAVAEGVVASPCALSSLVNVEIVTKVLAEDAVNIQRIRMKNRDRASSYKAKPEKYPLTRIALLNSNLTDEPLRKYFSKLLTWKRTKGIIAEPIEGLSKASVARKIFALRELFRRNKLVAIDYNSETQEVKLEKDQNTYYFRNKSNGQMHTIESKSVVVCYCASGKCANLDGIPCKPLSTDTNVDLSATEN
jgi:hypothetical protein